jgi:hypothetical protein
MLRDRSDAARRMNRAIAAWLAFVVPVWLVFVLCTYWEPIIRDGWGHFFWHREANLSFKSLWDFTTATYRLNNPRLGQVFTLVQYTPGPVHPIMTPLVELSLFYLLATLMLGRWPSLRRTGDALLTATIIAMVFATARSLGPMLFYRPFTGNYLFGFTLNLLWLVPYRLHVEQPLRGRWWLIVPMLVLGFASGMCNEHTGPTFLLAGLVALAIYWRRGERVVPWAWAGIVGIAAGGITLFLAPGQALRYAGLAQKQSTLDLIVERGPEGNARILFALPLFLLPLVLWIVPAAIARVRRVPATQPRSHQLAQIAAAVMAVLIVVTILASPKWGDRLYFASTCLACAAAAGWFCGRLGRIERWYAVAIATLVIGFVSIRLLVAYHTAGKEFEARLAAITHAAPGTTVRVPPYSQERSRYILGDDFVHEGARAIVAEPFRITIELDQREPTTPPPAVP